MNRKRCWHWCTGIAVNSLLPAVLLLLLPSLVIAQDPVNGEVAPTEAAPEFQMPSLWDLAIQGGWFMIPIGVASIITIAFTLERLVGLRRGRLLPGKLLRKLRAMMTEPTLDPRRLWDACEEHRSPLANICKAAVLKTGRSQPEVEKAVEDAVNRETGLMLRNMRPINVVASISPLLGLLGTVQGMIMAFMVTSTTTSTGTAKAQELAHGIYTALVTTFAGLSVAVISVVLANFLEGRIEKILRQLEDVFLDLLPRLERYEGKIRIVENSPAEEPGIKVKTLQPADSMAPTNPAAIANPVAATNQAANQERATQSAATRRPGRPGASQRGGPASQQRREAASGALADEDSTVQDAVAHNESTRTTLRSHFDR